MSDGAWILRYQISSLQSHVCFGCSLGSVYLAVVGLMDWVCADLSLITLKLALLSLALFGALMRYTPDDLNGLAEIQ